MKYKNLKTLAYIITSLLLIVMIASCDSLTESQINTIIANNPDVVLTYTSGSNPELMTGLNDYMLARKNTKTPPHKITPILTPTKTFTPIITYTKIPTLTNTPTKTNTLNPTSTQTASLIPTNTFTPTFTRTASVTPTNTPIVSTPSGEAFTFVSIGDAQGSSSRFSTTIGKIATNINPAFIIFNGDFENDGVTSTEMNTMTSVLKNYDMYNRAFLVRGNHDNHISGSAVLWENFFETSPNIRSFPSGITNYTAMNTNSDYLTFSFEYGNSMFLGVDIPGQASLMTSAQIAFLDARLSYAESIGLTHAFLYWHGPVYCAESVHCTCTSPSDSTCSPSSIISLINRHPIISATFHGHEHLLGWTHLDSTRIASLTNDFEEFLTSPSGGYSYNQYLYPERMDYVYTASSNLVYAGVTVDGNQFTVNYYTVTSNIPVWSRTFIKDGGSITPIPTLTKTPTKTSTPTSTVSVVPTTQVPTTPPPQGSLSYYMVDRVTNVADFANLASMGIDTAVVDFDINGSQTRWQSVFTEAAKYGINIVVWASDYNNPRPNCSWKAPFPVTPDGDITKVIPLMDVATQYPNFIGMVNGHESFWTCTNMTFDEMAGLKTKLKDYAASKGRDIQIWNYINSLYTTTKLPDNEISRIMDVAVTWKHCAGNSEGTCSQSLAQVQSDRTRLNNAGLSGQIKLVFLIQTFAIPNTQYATKFTRTELEQYSCQFIGSNNLDGFAYYTWYAGWWDDLHAWSDVIPAVESIHTNCVQ